jgi:hypothetical protein
MGRHTDEPFHSIGHFNIRSGKALLKFSSYLSTENRDDFGLKSEDLLFEKLDVETCREADDFKSLRKLADDIKGIDPDRACRTEDGQTFHGVSFIRRGRR